MKTNWEVNNNANKFSEFMVSTNENEEGILLGILIGFISIIVLF